MTVRVKYPDRGKREWYRIGKPISGIQYANWSFGGVFQVRTGGEGYKKKKTRVKY